MVGHSGQRSGLAPLRVPYQERAGDGDCWESYEDEVVTISRATGTLTLPANFMLVAAMNPCPCGYYDDPLKECTCSAMMIRRYRPTPLICTCGADSGVASGISFGHKRISGPLHVCNWGLATGLGNVSVGAISCRNRRR
jgi:hypothetical protein